MGKNRGSRLTIALLGFAAASCLGAAAASGQTPAGAAESVLRRDAALSRALELEAKGESAQAAEVYRSWLEAHGRTSSADAKEAELYLEALLRFASLEPDARLVEHYLSAAPPAALPPAGRSRLRAALAELHDALGDVEGAQAAYLEASRSDPDQGSPASRRLLLRSAALAYEEGIFDRAEALVREVLSRSSAAADEALEAESLYVLGRVLVASGRPEEAAAAWSTVRDEHAASKSAPAACLGLWMLWKGLGREQEAESALTLLEGRYASSPEREISRLMRGLPGRVSSLVHPWAVLEPFGIAALSVFPEPAEQKPPPTQPEPPPVAAPAAPAAVSAAAPEPTGLVAVLAGSYTNRANAERHAADLVAESFPARVVEVRVGSKLYYRVLVGEALTREAAMELIQRLKDRSFESVPLQLEGGQ